MKHIKNTKEILQAISRLHEATPQEIHLLVPNISRATLYRKLDQLYKEGVLTVVQEQKGRGGYHRTYTLAREEALLDASNIEEILSSLGKRFSAYLKNENANLRLDGYFINSLPLYMEDETYAALLRDLNTVLRSYLRCPPGMQARKRELMVLSIPIEEEH